ncbi:MAG: CBU_0592 family membrane protein [Cellvibrionaceae bacterium]
MSILSLLGWFGTLLYLINHGYISLITKWKPSLYYGGNLVAALSLVITSVVAQSWQAVVINGFWALISILLLAKVDLKRFAIAQSWYMGGIALLWLWLAVISVQAAALDLTVLGWTSAYVFSLAYLLFSAGRMEPQHYLLWNGYAALALLPQLWLDQNLPVLTLEIAWACLSFYGAARKYSQIHLID